jgi:hypothetical protein
MNDCERDRLSPPFDTLRPKVFFTRSLLEEPFNSPGMAVMAEVADKMSDEMSERMSDRWRKVGGRLAEETDI